MTATPSIPFSARAKGSHRQIDSDFPDTGKAGLLHLLADLIEQGYVADWIVIARELHRIGRLELVSYDTSSVSSLEQAKANATYALETLQWQKVYDFCERLYSKLPNQIGWEDNYGNYTEEISRSDSQAYIAAELQRLFLEESLAYEFTDGAVRRRGRKHTVELASKSQVVLGAAELISARQHYEKALQFFRHPTKPDFENAVKEAVCAVEATGKVLFPMAKASTLGDLIKWFGSTSLVSVPKALTQTLNGIYAFRNGAEGVAHGAATGGKASVEVTEYVLAVCASQIIYLVDLANGFEGDVPF
ncbi:hypothetical protein N879_01960 [Alcaligenes sp. EGD-AK7]|uniref:AbiJ-NTD4 domain-containing protein n=1 Tax=Alcaligenes sp. EGD-AK7 TaxID=1386079 RepID=UPI0002FBAE21|nr:hypothetical protein [Alcaligenes sp. EGD-AK7]ERI34306.1 hypothetical protein N879_01960 [Alcaligenes sp. EGD-AK7]